MSNTLFQKTLFSVMVCAVMLALVPAPASAQLPVKSEDVTLKFGFQGQFWADWTQDATAASAGNQGYAQNFYLLRARLMFGGTIGDNISFFFQTDDPKLGLSPSGTAATKTLTTGNATSPGFVIQDALCDIQSEQSPGTDGRRNAGAYVSPGAAVHLELLHRQYQLGIHGQQQRPHGIGPARRWIPGSRLLLQRSPAISRRHFRRRTRRQWPQCPAPGPLPAIRLLRS